MQISKVPQPSGVRKLHWGTTTRRWQLTLPTLQLMFSPQLTPPQCAAQVWTSGKVHRLRVRNVSLILFHLLPAKKPRPRMFLQQSDHCKVSLHTSEKAEPFRAGRGGLARLFTDNWNRVWANTSGVFGGCEHCQTTERCTFGQPAFILC